MEFALCAALALLIRLRVANVARISGQSMTPTLRHRDWALVWRLPYLFRAPRRQEVVICHYPGRRLRYCRWLPQAFVKRVIGLPGDVIEIAEGVVHINGEALPEKYLSPDRCRLPRSMPPRTLGPDEYFVMGDHRDRSNDSRSIGPLSRRAIRGRVVCVFWPASRCRRIG